MKKIFILSALVMMVAVLLTACGNNSNNNSNTSDTSDASTTSNFIREEDNRPPIIKEGLGSHLELPASADDVICMLVTNEREKQLRQQGYDFITKPLSVTRNGEEHVQLGRVATVSFDIPEDFPKDQYDELVGVLITENGPKYKIPDYYALREGVVKFETTHFCEVGAEKDKKELRKRFIEKVAVNGWQRNMDNKALEPTWKEQLTKFADDHCLGENDLAGIAARELFADNDVVKIGLDIVNAHDMENASLEQRMKVASENMVKVAEAKLLSYFLDKLKEEDTKKKKVMDELKSEKKGETIYKTEIEQIDSKRNQIIDVLQDRFSIENVEEVSTLLGDEPSVEKCYIFACEQVGKYAKDQLESKAVEILPYISMVQKMATAVEIGKKFWACTQMNDLYENYKKEADRNGGVVSNDMWNAITYRVATPEFLHDMTDAQIREKLNQRYCAEAEIAKRKAEATKLLDIIETYVDLNSPCLEKKHFDYIQRLTIVNNLLDRFRSELVDKDGELVFNDDGYRRVYSNPNTVNEQLCYVINKYFECYPDRDSFYAWLSRHGYNYGQLKKEYDKLDDLLWKKKPQYDPDIHIVIKETLGAESGSAKCAGRTICLGTNGKPYKAWYRNIPDEDWVRDQGWSTEFPAQDSDVLLSQYKAIGMPNQVLVYATEEDFMNSRAPIETFVFKVDTMNRHTVVELNKKNEKIMEFVFDTRGWNFGISWTGNHWDDNGEYVFTPRLHPVASRAMENAMSDIHLFLKSKGDDFTFTGSGEASSGSTLTHIDLTVNVNANFEEWDASGTCSITATLVEYEDSKPHITAHFKNLTGEIEAMDVNGRYDYSLKCKASGSTRIESVTYWENNVNIPEGKTSVSNLNGNIYFTLQPPQ